MLCPARGCAEARIDWCSTAGAKWSPDGLSLLAASEDCWCASMHARTSPKALQGHARHARRRASNHELLDTQRMRRLRLFDLPPDIESSDGADDWAADVRIFEGETVYDFAWYPFMSSEDPATCVFATSSRVRRRTSR